MKVKLENQTDLWANMCNICSPSGRTLYQQDRLQYMVKHDGKMLVNSFPMFGKSDKIICTLSKGLGNT